MKTAVIYGAGNIGRGFIGQLFYESGYETVFIDINEAVIKEMNDEGAYTINRVAAKACDTVRVENITAVDGRDLEAVAEVISKAELMAVSVGVNVLPYIIDPLLAGFKRRMAAQDSKPLNILVCENLMNAANHLTYLVSEKMTDSELDIFKRKISFVDTTIGRMVPVATGKSEEASLLDIAVEPYCELPVDKDTFLGEIPQVVSMKPSSPFMIQTMKKLFIHNMGHAICSYYGASYGKELISEAMEIEAIETKVKNAMTASAQAIAKKWDYNYESLKANVDDLVERFKNPYLKDTVLRVAKDPVRKLKHNDRLIGALLLCEEVGVDSTPIIEGIAAALAYEDQADDNWTAIRGRYGKEGLAKVLGELTELDETSPLVTRIVKKYNEALTVNIRK